MSLALFLLAKTIADTVEVSRSVAATAQTAAAAAQIASSVVTIKNERARTELAKAEAERAQAEAARPQAPVDNPIGTYEVDLFLAKVAMLSYIAKADRIISPAERTELEQTLAVAKNIYGQEVVYKARGIFNSEGTSFTSLEPYLRKVQNSDLDAFIFYSEEYAKADNEMTSEEKTALTKLRSYIESRKGKKTFENLTCPRCAGAMHPDSYGYKATCGFCGYEIVMNVDNSPQRTGSFSKCTKCGATFNQFRNSGNFNFCTYCGGRVVAVGTVAAPVHAVQQPVNTGNVRYANQNGPNVYITYTTVNPGVGMVTRIVSTGVKNTYSNGMTLGFRLAQGNQTIILKIGKKNYSRNVVIHPSNSPVRIYASFNGRANIAIDQPPY